MSYFKRIYPGSYAMGTVAPGHTPAPGYTSPNQQGEMITLSLAEIQAYQDVLSLLTHDKPYDPNWMKNIKHPHLKKLLLEAICKRTLKE